MYIYRKESAYNVGDLGLIPGLGRFPGEGNGYPLQYSGLENSMDKGAWQATVHQVTKSRTRLSFFHFTSLRVCVCVCVYVYISLDKWIYTYISVYIYISFIHSPVDGRHQQ